MADVTIAVLGTQSETALRSLRQWLQGEPALRGRLHLAGAAPLEGEMGSALEILTVVGGAGGALTVLLEALKAWLHHQRPNVFVEVTYPDGTKVTVNVDHVEDPDALLSKVLPRPSGEE